MSDTAAPPVKDATRREQVAAAWAAIADKDGWDIVNANSLYASAIDALAWTLLDQTSDLADRAPTEAAITESYETATRMLEALRPEPTAT